nr:ferritin-like domain-containing protein [Kibdelosporangium sp. MJ126-NF4]CEL16765.1 hypothetical protein [Kibdelosporangium sp. MJ126-NF4]CTQ92005.1 hypothetical protein [Kibdelosporangium sp. MJ126-NF4]
MTQPTTTSSAVAKTVPADSVDAVQQALGAEHGAIWTYGLVSAFLPSSFNAPLNEGVTTHRARRDAIERALTAGNATPKPAEAAYVPPQPVSDQASSLAVLAIAESDAAVAWRSVLEHTDDVDLRKTALEALTSSAVRATRWRKAAGAHPATPAMPGLPASS